MISAKLHIVIHISISIVKAIYFTFDILTALMVGCSSVCLQKHHSPALPDHHPGKEIPQSPDVPGRPAEYPRGSQSQVGGAF